MDVPYWKNDLAAELWILLGITCVGLTADRLMSARVSLPLAGEGRERGEDSSLG